MAQRTLTYRPGRRARILRRPCIVTAIGSHPRPDAGTSGASSNVLLGSLDPNPARKEKAHERS
jgi:hypothetical protein